MENPYEDQYDFTCRVVAAGQAAIDALKEVWVQSGYDDDVFTALDNWYEVISG